MDEIILENKLLRKEVKRLHEQDELIPLKVENRHLKEELNKGYPTELAQRLNHIEEMIYNLLLLVTNKKQTITLKRKKNQISPTTRKKILLRDNYACQNCGFKLRDNNKLTSLHIDHIIPISSKVRGRSSPTAPRGSTRSRSSPTGR